ncbi:hypothetical protein [Paenibacillus roseipurpureus]|uniref:Uncharacterized protein n=1 Tax=Paenibacillus roseopurpureus TaxID=2918901 RepID=A0AA96LXF6_9BACL|nr:hypothetical protein [Paenibacillus sp. MBLB1832]WNR46315.1 hypothetical protein MJB10_09550 [Paenibacillus sp. MBLB1832]
MDKSHYFDHVCNDTIPTLPEEEATTATDLISEAVEEIVDNLRHPFSSKTSREKE